MAFKIKDRFTRRLKVGEIHQRDKWQFELKSEFFPLPELKKNIYTQEFYLFVPNSLQVNEDTYPKAQFYKDQTNLIRYKTPEIHLQALYAKENKKSPLYRLKVFLPFEQSHDHCFLIEDELKLLGNIIRSSLRERIRILIEEVTDFEDENTEEKIFEDVQVLCEELTELRRCFLNIQSEYMTQWTSPSLQSHFLYTDEFISNTINYYLTGFLEHLCKSSLSNRQQITEMVCEVLADEKQHREKILHEPKIQDRDMEDSEYILYRDSLLNKFIVDALLLSSTRSSLIKRYRNVVGSIAAGIAMFVFFVLFVWQGEVFLINSLPFILITVFLYILKDRIKEGLKTLSYSQFTKWFSDYETDIQSPDETITLGKMKESVSFVQEKDVPKEIVRIRNREFHAVLETFKRPEQVLYYKKKISMFQQEQPKDVRRQALNIIFRFNINQFVKKADNPTHSYITVDPETLDVIRTQLPKVYHLNIILKNTYTQQDLTKKVELKKFRLILDKNGIRRVEHVHYHPEE